MEAIDRPIPAWLASDVADSNRIKALKALTTPGTWYAEHEQDGEYTGPGDDPPGYAGEWYETGSILADPDDCDPSGNHTPIGVFSTAYPRHEMPNTHWAIAAHNDDAEGRYGRILAEYLRMVQAVRIATQFLPIFPEHTGDLQWSHAMAIHRAELHARGETPERIGWMLEALDKDRDARKAARGHVEGGGSC